MDGGWWMVDGGWWNYVCFITDPSYIRSFLFCLSCLLHHFGVAKNLFSAHRQLETDRQIWMWRRERDDPRDLPSSPSPAGGSMCRSHLSVTSLIVLACVSSPYYYFNQRLFNESKLHLFLLSPSAFGFLKHIQIKTTKAYNLIERNIRTNEAK